MTGKSESRKKHLECLEQHVTVIHFRSVLSYHHIILCLNCLPLSPWYLWHANRVCYDHCLWGGWEHRSGDDDVLFPS